MLVGVILNTHTVMAIYYTEAFFDIPFFDYSKKWFGEFLIVLLLWVVLRSLYIATVKKFGGLENLKKRLLIIPFFLIPYFVLCVLYLELFQPFFDWDYKAYTEPSQSVQILTGAIIFFIDMGFFEALFLFVELKNSKIKEETVKKENVTSQLVHLKNQISPHFLFNSLNTLVHLIDIDKEKSKEFVHRLATVYKNTLEVSELDLISLQDELEYIKSYTSLLKERFGTNVHFEFDIHKDYTHKKVVPLSLQLAIENAVKHNIITKKQPLKVNIKAAEDYLVIKNNLQKKVSYHKNYGLGLSNIVKRYELLTKRGVIIEKGQSDFVLKIPLLN